ncbi:hypothetical protein WN944_021855 [Citrus x changshan-huyou]|uniref:AAA+ ATPase domain-containing protein n=1 Tax=Citrus x changshan-huyou TaxID=2935761 RepID=A0AAP0R0T4_9ROSI
MAVETTVLLVIVKLRQVEKEIIDPALASQVRDSIKELKSLEGQEGNGLSPEFLRAVYLAEDTIDTFLKEIRKEFYRQQNHLVKAGIDLRSAYIKSRFSDKMKKLVGVIKEESSAMLEDAAALTSSKSRKKPELQGTRSSTKLPVENAAFNNASEAANSNKKTGMLDFILKDEVKDLAELILSDYPSPLHIPVVDVAGSAETPELWKIYSCDDIKNHFQCRAWFLVPPRLDKRELAINILNQFAPTDVELEEKLLESPQTVVHNYLIHKRYLVILTDVRTPDIWEIIKFLFPNSLSGSRVILSFREADAAMHRNLNFFGGDLNLSFKEMKARYPLHEAVVVRNDDDVTTIRPHISVAEILGPEAELVGLEDQLLRLAQLTMSSSSKYFLISVVGVAGSGKTTLVETIYNSSYIRQNFEYHAWANVYVSHDFDLRKVFINILEQVTRVKIAEELALNELESRLIRLFQSKRYLIVLDDVHLPGAWYELQRIFSPNTSSSGSRVILLTREAFVARAFSPSIILLQLRPLNVDESWELFLKKVGREKRASELLNLKEKIWKKCGGLPLAICVLGGLLSTNRQIQNSDWEKVIEGFTPGGKKKEKQIQHVEQVASDKDQSGSQDELPPSDNLDASSIWGLGYKYLSAHLKACLHYLCLFPKSHEIPVRRLLQLWLAERFVTPSEGEEMTPEDRARKDFEQLEQRNMIEVVKRRSDGRPKTCRVPSTLYDTFQNAEKMGFYRHHKEKSDSTSSLPELCIRRLSEHLDNQNNSVPPDECIEYLHSYLTFDNRMGDKPADEVGNLLNKTINRRGYRLLRVLDLEGVYKPVLPETVGKLQLLRYFGLRWTFLDSIPESVGDLPCLETLDLKHTNITSLPKSIWKVKTLRHLYMNDIYLQMSVQKPFVKYSLTNLQTLWCLLIGNKSPPLNWLESLRGLKKLGLSCHIASLGQIAKWIQDLRSLESLRLRSLNDFGEPSDLVIGPLNNHRALNELYLLGKLPEPLKLDKLPPNLRILTLSLSYLSEDPMPVLGQLKELNILRLFAHSFMGEEMTCGDGGFPKLRVLKLWVQKELREWTIGKEAMPELRELEIRCCKKMKKPIELEKLSSLKELTLTDMKKSFEYEVRGSMAKTVNIVINPPQGKNMHWGETESSARHHKLLLESN